MKKLIIMMVFLLSVVFTAACGSDTTNSETADSETQDTEINESETIDIQILATSDLHGKMVPWDYMLDTESYSGSMTQLATAIKEKRNENTLVLDSGDVIQDNLAEIFIDSDLQPMIHAMSYIGYDACTTGNHEYNFGIDNTKKYIETQNATVVLGNVYDENGERLSKPYEIFERGGVKIAVVGMVTPNIASFDSANLKDCTVTNPIDECKAIMPELQEQADIIIGLMHMGLDNELETYGSGVRDLTEACPEFDLIIAAHDHTVIEGEYLNNVLVVENKNQAQTMSEIHILVDKTDEGYTINSITSASIDISQFESDAELEEQLEDAHQKALEYAHETIGSLKDGNLVPENEIEGVPIAQLQDTAMQDLVLNTLLEYSGADVASTALTSETSYLDEGEIRRCDVARIYKYDNSLYVLKMTGAQLKTYMEWSAGYYQQYEEGDLTIAFNPDKRIYLYDTFEGVNYDIDISMDEGDRIVNLTWPDGTPVREDDSLTIAVSNYRANTHLLEPGVIYEEGNLPELIEMDVHSNDIGNIASLIADYIVNEQNGIITPSTNNNWKIIGNDWDEELHKQAVEQINEGLVEVNSSKDSRSLNINKIRVEDLK